ncbi:MAG: flagellar biosynthetic protein FliQ [Phycisphaerae bacterium]|nr:flagellar biosynthetic protein FliQ [Phycisphaerae bacterium]|tara:strand:+ start:380 stop:631 length:252 start_codon:yes stop_codon:yes gene_type:complete
MTGDAIDAVRIALYYTLILATPVLGVGLVVGLVVSLIQAVTQVQEQTLSFVPKIIAMLVAAILLLAWMVAQISDFAVEMFTAP